MAVNRAVFMRRARRFVSSFLPLVLAVSTLSAISVATAPSANANTTGTIDRAWSKNDIPQSYASFAGNVIPSSSTSPWTFETWIYPNSTSTSVNNEFYGIFSQQQDGTTANRTSMWLYNGNIHYSTGAFASTFIGFKFEASHWYHVALTSNGASTAKLFVNGIEVGSQSFTQGTAGGTFTLGGTRQENQREFAGHIDQTKVWNITLTSEQLTESMHTYGVPASLSSNNLLAHYDFNDYSSSGVSDKSGKNYNLTFNTAVTGNYASTDFTDSAIIESSTVNSDERVIQFKRTYLTSNGGWTHPTGYSTFRSLVIAGGGGGGAWVGGGGGAGGYVETTSTPLASTTIGVRVGQGGRGTYNKGNFYTEDSVKQIAVNGQDSALGAVATATGGGAGASYWPNADTWGALSADLLPKNGGSGGGGSGNGGQTFTSNHRTGASGTSGQGNSGGNGVSNSWQAAGGGGANSVGSNGVGGGGTTPAGGAGGSGKTSNITGTNVERAGGGGGGDHDLPTRSGGASGGGGAGGANGVSGTANTGGGGGGGANAGTTPSRGGMGGAGVVILRYKFASISANSLDTKVTAPVRGAIPSTTSVDDTQYTGTVAWFESNGTTAAPSTFAANTIYVAKVTLTAKTGYTLNDLTGTFTYTGATGVNYSSGVISITFPATAHPSCSPTSSSSGGFTVVTFTNTTTCNWNVPAGVTAADILVVGGGGGGGTDGGSGGGGGELRFAAGYSTNGISTLSIRVGAGGVAGTWNGSAAGSAGSISTIQNASTTLFEARGGAGGGGFGATGPLGGTGGTGGTGTAGQNGGAGITSCTAVSRTGGTYTLGGAPAGTAPSNSITGSSTSYGGGGGGGSGFQLFNSGTFILGTAGGGTNSGGRGSNYKQNHDGTAVTNGAVSGQAGFANTGGGGGGGSACDAHIQQVGVDGTQEWRNANGVTQRNAGGAGAQGVVIVRYANVINFSYDLNGATSGSLPTGGTVQLASSFTTAASTGISRTNYNFGGWCTTQPVAGASCGGTLLTAGTAQTMPNSSSSQTTSPSSLTLYAVWTGASQTISYGNGGGTGSGPTSPTSVAFGSTFTTPANTYTRNGYYFTGWNDGASNYLAGATYPATGTVSGSVTLNAQWASCGSGVVQTGLLVHLDAGNTCSTTGSTSAWSDISVNGNNATLLNAPTYEGTLRGKYYTFSNGTTASNLSSGKYATLANGVTDFSTGFTFSFFASFSASAPANETILSFGSSQGSGTNEITVYRSNNFLNVYTSNWNGICSSTNSYLSNGTFRHYVITWTPGGDCVFYRDGILDRTVTPGIQAGKSNSISGSRPIANIGRAVTGSLSYFGGAIGDLAIYNVPISATEVVTNYLAQADATYTVTYNGNGNSSGSVPTDSSSPYVNGATITAKANSGTLAKTGYTFNNWCSVQVSAGATCASGSGTSYTAGSGTFTIGTSNVTLFALWTASAVTIATPSNGLTGTINSAYTLSIAVSGGTGSGTYSLPSGSLPAGVSLNPSTGEISGTPTVSGSFAITVRFTDASGAIATTSSFSIVISKLTQTITFNALNNRTLGSGTYSVSASASSSLSVSLTSATTLICTISSGTITLVAAGTCTINADQSGNSTYSAAAQVQQSFTVASTLTITTPNGTGLSGSFNTPYSLTIVATGGAGTKAFSATGSLPSGVSISTGGVISGTPSTAGDFDLTVTATDANNATATTSSFRISIAKGTSSLGLSIGTYTFNGNEQGPGAADVSSRSGSGGSITFSYAGRDGTSYTSSPTKPTAVGSYRVTATLAADSNYASVSTTADFAITSAGLVITPTISASSMVYGTSSGLPTISHTKNPNISLTTNPTCALYLASDTSFATAQTISSTLAVGSYVVRCAGAAATNYTITYGTNPSFSVTKANQTAISSPVLSASSKSFPYSQTSLTVNSVSGGSGTGALSVSAVADGTATGCSLSGSTLSATSAGTCTLTITKAADSNFEAATTTATFTFSKASQTITITSTAPSGAKVAGSTYTLTATGGASGNAVTFSSTTTGVCTISTATVTFVGPGTCTLAANQVSATGYDAATQVTQTFTVAKGDPSLSSFANVSKTIGDSAFTLTAPTVANSLAGAFTYASGTVGTATIANSGGVGTVTIVGAGTSVITATFTPTDTTNYNTATITMTLTVNAIYTVTYQYNGATGGNSTSSSQFTQGGTVLTLPTPTRTGSSFAGWFSDSGFSSRIGGAGGSYSPSGATTSITAYARWVGISTTNLLLHVDAANPASYSGSGSTWNDLSGNENHLALCSGSVTLGGTSRTVTAPTFDTANGGVFNFDSQYDCVNKSSLNLSASRTSFSYFTWIKPSSIGVLQSIAMSHRSWANTSPIWRFDIAANGKLFFLDFNGTTGFDGTSSGTLSANQWAYVGFVRNGNTVTFYINGVSSGSISTTTSVTYELAGVFNVGFDYRDGVNPFGGSIGAIHYYTAAISAQTISSNYYESARVAIAPVNTAVPTVSGTMLNGQTLTATTGTWSPVPNSYSYQWKSSSDGSTYTNISGATSNTYTLTSSENGKTLRVEVIATNGTGNGLGALSAATAASATQYTITLNRGTNGTGSDQTLTKTSAVTLTLPNSATANGYFTRTGHTVTGWSTSDGGSQSHALGGSFTTDSPTTLYPVWTANTQTITYAAGTGGSGSGPSSPSSVSYGSTFTTPANTYTRTGFNFAGWTDGTNTYNAGATYPLTGTVSANVTLTATWNEITAAAAFHAEDYTSGSGTWTDRVASATGTTATGGMTKSTSPTSVVFAGRESSNSDNLTGTIGSTSGLTSVTVEMWLKLSDNGSTQNAAGSMLFAWKANTGSFNYNIYHRASSIGFNAFNSELYGVDSTAYEQKWSHFVFVMSNTGDASTQKMYINGVLQQTLTFRVGTAMGTRAFSSDGSFLVMDNSIAVNTWNAKGNLGLVRVYRGELNSTQAAALYNGTKSTYEQVVVTYNSQSGSSVDAGTAPIGGSISSAPTAPTRAGFSFSGWSTTSSGSVITFPYTHNQTADFTLFAIWAPNSLTVTFDSQGGSVVSNGTVAANATLTAPTPPTRAGYTFSGWSTTSAGSVVSFTGGYIHGQTANFTLYAIWSANALTITYDSKGGSSVANGTVNTGASVSSAPTAPTRTGYTFSAWSATDGGAAITFPYAHNQTANFTLFALWTANSLTVTYNSKGGSDVTSGLVNTGASISSAPTAPTRTGYTFSGWSATDGGTVVTFPYAHGQTASFTLFAVWAANALTVTYDSQGGSAVSSGTVNTAASIQSAPTAPTSSGYYFLGWSATSVGVTVAFPYAHGQTSNFTLYAIWTIAVETTGLRINLDASNRDSLATSSRVWRSIAPGRTNVSTSSSASDTTNVTFTTISTPGFATFPTGSDGLKMFSAQLNGGASIVGTSGVTVETWIRLADNYSPSSTVQRIATHWLDSGSGAETNDSKDWNFRIVDGSLALLHSDGLTNRTVTSSVAINQKFAGQWIHVGFTWTASGTVRFYLNGTPVGAEFAGLTRGGSRTVTTAQVAIGSAPGGLIGSISKLRVYEGALTASQVLSNFENEFDFFGLKKITFNANDGSGTPAISTQWVPGSTSKTLNSNAFTRTGYTFAGWTAAADGTGTSYTDGQSISISAALTIFAKWTADGNVVVFNNNSGSGTMSNQSITSGTATALTTNSFTRTGYTFAGWNTAANGSGTAYTNGQSVTITAGTTLFAQWTGTTNTVTYDSKGGTSVSNGSFVTGGSISSAPTAPTRAGYTLSGWSLTDGGSVITFPYSPTATSGITLYAVWAAISCSPTSTTAGGYTIYTFTTAGTCFWTVPNGVTDVEILAVAGGGGGGYAWDNAGAGGGAGGQVRTGTATLSTTLEVTVGAGGTAGTTSSRRGGTGGNTVVSTLTAVGGTGGCAARATSCSLAAQATALAGATGGAGGAGGTFGRGGGGSNTSALAPTIATGGAGTASSFSGTSVTYSVGGAGGTNQGFGNNITGTTGSANTGNGGGGASAKNSSGDVNGGAGSAGLVVVRVASTLTITFDSQSGSSVSNGSTLTGGAIATAPTDPTRANYTFLGWFTATTGGSAITFPYAHGQTANFTLFARWALNTYSIVFNANNGTGTMSNQSVTHGVAANLNANLFTRANYVFHRWATNADGTGTTYNNLAEATLTAGTTLYAQWTANTYVVTFNYNSATGGNSTTSSSFTTGGSAISLPTPTRTGYTFGGWHSDAGLTTQIGSGGGTGNYSPTGTTLSLTAFAKWTAIDYTFTYNGNSSDGGTVPTETSKQIDQTATVKANTGSLTRAGYTFAGWNTQSNGSGDNYLSGSLFTVQSSDVNLFAKWNANTYTITYNSNGGTGSAVRSTSNVSSDSYTTGGTSLTLPDKGTLARAGYTFAGWNTSADGSGTNRLEAATFTTVSDVIFYAKWNPITYTITYNGNTSDGGTTPTEGGYTTGQASPYTVLANSFTKTSSVFGGWNTAADRTGTNYSPGATFTTLADIVLYAIWIPQFTLHYAINGGTVTSGSLPADALLTQNTPVNVFSSVERTGYTFDGWTNGASTIAPGGSFNIVQNSVLTAKWTAINYTISYNSDGGTTPPSSITRQIGQSYTIGNAPAKPGHDFTGWKTGTTVVGAGATIVMGSIDVTYTAQWSPKIYTISYDWNGGRGTAVSDVSYTFGTTAITLPLVGDRVRDGYNFAGWAESANGSALGLTYIPSQTRTLYALWTLGNFTVTYDAGRGTIVNSTVAVSNGGSTVLPLPTRANFVFNGWHSAVTGGSRIGGNGDSFTPAASRTIYARWIQSSLFGITDSLTRIGSVITADNVSNTFSGANSNSSVAVSVPANALPAGTTINFDLVGNSSRAVGLLPGISYVVSMAISWLTADETVPDTASGKPISVTITNASIKAGAVAYAIVNNVSTLLGTATQDGSITVALTSDPEVVVAATKPGAPTNVAATSNGAQQSIVSWSAPSSNGGAAITGYTVTASPGAGTCTTSGTSCTISSLTNATAYTFTVIATNSVGNSAASTAASATTAGLHAVAFDAKGGSTVTSGSFLTTSTVSEPTAPTRAGYSLAGWSATDGGNVVIFPYAPGVATDITMFARWDALDNAVTFDSKGGSSVTASVFSSGGTVAEPAAPTRTGFTFAGWSATDGGTTLTFPYAPGVVTDITLYAKWNVVSSNVSGGGSNAGGNRPDPAPSAGGTPVRNNLTIVAPVTVVGVKDAKVIAVEIRVPTPESGVKPPSIKIDAASDKFIAEVKVVEGKLTLTPETGFSGRKTVTVTITENGEDRLIQIPLTVLPEPVAKPVLTPTASNRTVIRWTESPNAEGYTVLLNGKRVCTTTASSCSVRQVLGPDAVIEIVSTGGDRTFSQRVEADFRQNVPVPITRIVSATNTKATLTRVDTRALDKVVALIRTQGFGTVVISEISTNQRTAPLAAARIAAIKRYIDDRTGNREIIFEIVPPTSRTSFNNISVKG